MCEEEGAAERNCYGLISAPLSPSLSAAGVGGSRRVKSESVKLSLEKEKGRKGCQEGVLVFVFASYCPLLF